MTEDEQAVAALAAYYDDPERAFSQSSVDAMKRALKAAHPSLRVQYGIFRESGTPDMSGKPNYVQIVNATFGSLNAAKGAARRLPALRAFSPIIQRRQVTDWEDVDEPGK